MMEFVTAHPIITLLIVWAAYSAIVDTATIIFRRGPDACNCCCKKAPKVQQ